MIKMRVIRWAFFMLVVGVGISLFRSHSKTRSDTASVRAIWVTRFDYSTPTDVRRIFDNLAGRGFTDVFFQVRGNGTVYYPSTLEPWAYQLSGNDLSSLGVDPGWDPLRRAVEMAHHHEMRLHAYMNALPGWSGLESPPLKARQLWTAHPDWFMVDAAGERMQPTSDWYAFVNPVLPEVRTHLRGIVSELCAYDVDGVHLDYIRYPHDYSLVLKKHLPDASSEELSLKSSFSFDPLSLEQQQRRYGENPSPNEGAEFRCDVVTRVVRDIAFLTEAERGNDFLLSASVLGDPYEGVRYAGQDAGVWVRQSLLDWAVQMNYNSLRFDQNIKSMKQVVGARGWNEAVVVGLLCDNEVEDILAQINAVEQSGCRGYALFSYGLLFGEDHCMTEKGRILLDRIRP